MALQIPNLDDRRFQDLVDEARRLIPRHCPRWTDHNLSDPGITLLELFAGLVETLIYRLNKVPDKSYIAFMNLMGVRLQPPSAARVAITFYLSAPLAGESQPVSLPADTEVSTVQNPAGRSVIFSTDTARICSAPRPLACLASSNNEQFRSLADVLRLDNTESLPAFSEKPTPGDSFALVDANDLSGHVLELQMRCELKGVGVTPDNPPRAWQAWCEQGWANAEIERDETGGLNKAGRVLLHLPQAMARREREGIGGYWLRCVVVPHTEGQNPYKESPTIQLISASTLGITVAATHSASIRSEIVGRSNGEPGQQFTLEHTPVLPRRAGERLEVLFGETWEPWEERELFAASRPVDMHYTLDGVSGEICFGPRIREPDGSERQYGAIPQSGGMIRMAAYRTGGGTQGNVGGGTLIVLKASLSYIDRVVNRREAAGGLDAETLERAKLRAPQILRTSERAVTAEDYEYLALAAEAGVRRARCVQPGTTGASDRPAPGVVRLLLVPAVEPAAHGLSRQKLSLAERPALTAAVEAYLKERRPLGTLLELGEPTYVAVAVEAQLRARREAEAGAVTREAYVRLERFLNPLVGGPDGTGWPFGRALYLSEIYALLQAVPGVEYLEQVTLRRDGPRLEARPAIEIPPDALLISGAHQIVTL